MAVFISWGTMQVERFFNHEITVCCFLLPPLIDEVCGLRSLEENSRYLHRTAVADSSAALPVSEDRIHHHINRVSMRSRFQCLTTSCGWLFPPDVGLAPPECAQWRSSSIEYSWLMYGLMLRFSSFAHDWSTDRMWINLWFLVLGGWLASVVESSFAASVCLDWIGKLCKLQTKRR